MFGKYEGNANQKLAEILDNIVSAGCCETVGSVDEIGHFAKVEHENKLFIVSTDSDGFVEYVEYETETERDASWAEIISAYEAFDSMGMEEV